MKLRVPYWYVLAVPLLLLCIGVICNQAVLIANWGKFPVMLNVREIQEMRSAQSAYDSDYSFSLLNSSVPLNVQELDSNTQFLDDVHSIMGHNSNMKSLADYINLGDAIYSPGDGFIILGELLWALAPLVWFVLIVAKSSEAFI